VSKRRQEPDEVSEGSIQPNNDTGIEALDNEIEELEKKLGFKKGKDG
jgi:hypothetical protein